MSNQIPIWNKDNWSLVILLLITTVSVYILPFTRTPLFVVIFALAFVSKRDYFWLAYIFVLLDAPGYLFSSQAGSVVNRLPFFSLAPQLSFDVFEVFLFLYMFKVAFVKQKMMNPLSKYYKLIGIHLLVVLVYTIVLGTSGKNFIITLRDLLPWLYLVILPVLIKSYDNLIRLVQLLIPVLLISALLTAYSLYAGSTIDGLLRGLTNQRELVYFGGGEAARLGSTITLAYIVLMVTCGMIMTKNNPFPRWYLFMSLFTCSLIIFLSATRGWILALIAILSLTLFKLSRHGGFASIFRTLLPLIGFTLIIGFAIINFSPLVKEQLGSALNRFATLEELTQGDVTAGGTLVRITERIPRIMQGIKISPILGLGFSDLFYRYADTHVGHHNMVLNIGLVGYSIFMGLFIYFVVLSLALAQRIKARGNNDLTAYAVTYSLLSLMIIHSTSRSFWGYMAGGQSSMFMMCLFFCWWSLLIVESRKPITVNEITAPINNRVI